MNDHEISIQILNTLSEILSGVKATRIEHDKILNSVQVIRNRLIKLNHIEIQEAKIATTDTKTLPEGESESN